MRPLLTCIALFTFLYPGLAQPELWVLDPQQPWNRTFGIIEDYAITLKPIGVYTEVGLYLTFSAQAGDFQNNTDLEVDFTFNLPEKAIVTDSWLWIDELIVKAKMLDRWTASQIYESIVDRRQDPSILVKNGPGDYRLRIYPMPGNGNRKVKITYLVPAEWHPDKVVTSVPIAALEPSVNALESIQIRTWLPPEWGDPRSEDVEDIHFQQLSQEDLGTFWEAKLNQRLQRLNTLRVATDAPVKNGLFLSTLESTDEQYYQMVLFPDQLLDLGTQDTKRVIVLFDYAPENSGLSQMELLEQVKRQLQTNLNATDFFNLVVTDLLVEPLSENWLPADSTTIELAFAALGMDPILNLNILASILGKSIDNIQKQSEPGAILLVTNNDRMTDLDAANTLIDEVLALRGEAEIPIHILNYQDRNVPSVWINDQRFKGNDYLFQILSQQTGGEYLSQLECCAALEDNMNTLFTTIGAVKGQMDVYTTLEHGFCYNRYTISEQGSLVNFKVPFVQVGKYSGNFPFRIELAGELDDLLFSDELTVSAAETTSADTLLQEVWAGQFLRRLEGESQNTAAINTIINRSIGEQVLSRYTALIALEPNLGGEPCIPCIDESREEGVIIGTEDKHSAGARLEAYPNPFREKVNIVIRFQEKIDPRNCRFALFNSLGQLVKQFEYQSYTGNNELSFVWSPRSETELDLPGGIYLFMAETPRGVHQLKLNYVR